MVVAGIGIVVNTATALLFMRGRESDLNIRGAFLHMAADALVSAGVVVAGALTLWMGWNWLDPVVSLRDRGGDRGRHLGPVPAVAAPAVRRRARRRGPARGAGACWSLPGRRRVHDLHVWAMGTSEIAMTAHLVMPEGHADDAFLQNATPTSCTTVSRSSTSRSRWCGCRSPSPVPAWRRLPQVGFPAACLGHEHEDMTWHAHQRGGRPAALSSGPPCCGAAKGDALQAHGALTYRRRGPGRAG